MLGPTRTNPLAAPSHPLDVHRPTISLSRLGHKWPPFRATIVHRGDEVILRNKGHESATVAFWSSCVCLIAAVGFWIATYSILPGMARDFSYPFAAFGAILAIVGFWLNRYYEEVTINWQAERLRHRTRSWLHTTDIDLTTARCQVLMHRVLLSRRRSPLSWHGYALCLWCDGVLLFPVCVVKKRELCFESLRLMGGLSHTIEFTYGGELQSTTDA